jgi:tetratricopeptide (TPR) repeat protein
LEDALLAFDEAIGLDPDLAAAYHYRAQIHYLQGDYEKAEADFAKAIALEPTQAEIYYNRGIMRFYRQDYANARVDFQAAIQRNADYGLAYYGLAIAEDALGNTQAAITAFEQARARAAQLPQGTRDYIESRLAALGSGGSAGFNVAGSYAHTQPGVQSEVYLSVTGTAGELVEATLNGPGVLGAAVQSGAIGADGKLTLTWAIDQTGNYTVSGTVGGKSFNVAVIVQ